MCFILYYYYFGRGKIKMERKATKLPPREVNHCTSKAKRKKERKKGKSVKFGTSSLGDIVA
jgi:hypothetical protein